MNSNKLIYILVIIAVAVGLLHLVVTKLLPQSESEPAVVACTADALVCPDGSTVGRVGPNCEFAECPTSETSDAPVEHEDIFSMIRVYEPTADALVSSPLQLAGEATGPWFFEASAPVEVQDLFGNVFGQGYVTAQDDWMTTNFVSFEGEIEFTVPDGVRQGVIVFKKDNPSGEPQFDNSVAIPVFFTE